MSESLNKALQLFRPPPRLNVAQWAEANRMMSRGQSPEPGRYRCDRLPYQREPMEGLTDPTNGGTILIWAKRLGKSEIMNNAIGFVIDSNPANILVKYPTREGAERWSKKSLAPMFRDTTALRDKVRTPRAKDAGNTIHSKEFPGGSITIVGANSPASLRAVSCKWIFQDEIDSDQPNTEGDPVDQADGRAEGFYDAVYFKSSTPTLKGISRIEKEFEESDQRYWFCRCPRCQHEQTLKWRQVKWTWPNPDQTERADPEQAVYVCESCHAELSDFERVRMVMAGRWIALKPHRRKRGYHLNGLYRIMGKKRHFNSYLHEFVVGFLDAKSKGRESLMFWTNTFLAETWEDEGEKVEVDPLLLRREEYGPMLPPDVCLLVAAVDVQGDRLECLCTGYGLAEETWAIQFRRLFGAPHKPEVWKKLDEWFQQSFAHPCGQQLKLAIMGIDTGGVVDSASFAIPVYRYVKTKQQASRGCPGVIAIKGSSIRGAPPALERLQKSGINLLMVGTDGLKSTVHERLRIPEHGPRFMHFPRPYRTGDGQLVDAGFGEDFYKQFAAEELRTRYVNGYPQKVWVKVAARNEALDLYVYTIGLYELLNPDMASLARLYAAKSKPMAPPMAENKSHPKEKIKLARFTMKRFT